MAQVARAWLPTRCEHRSWDSALDPHGRPEVRGSVPGAPCPGRCAHHLTPTSPQRARLCSATCHQQCQLPLPGA